MDELLARWNGRGNELRKEAAFQKELVDPLAMAANGNRLAMRERRRRDLRVLEQSAQDALTRWEERLHRIEEWKKSITSLQREEAQVQTLLRSSVWLQKARSHQDAFTRRLERHAEGLHARQQVLHEKLIGWLVLLQERESSLQELSDKQLHSERTIYVSRSRKQPEVAFAREQQAAGETLGLELTQLRRSLHHAQGRLQKAFRAIERQTTGAEIFYEVHKHEILSALKKSEKILQERREGILSDALTYETCRNIRRRLYETAQKLRCIEDLPSSSKPGWKRFFQFR